MEDPTRQPTSHILHAEDSPDDAELVRLALQRSGLAFSLERVDTEPDYTTQIERRVPDVILCDYDMPNFSAERALQIMRERGLDLPFIVVSNHIDQSAAVVAMQQGASDYLSKSNLGRLSKAITAATERAKERAERTRAERALRSSETMQRGILESLRSRIAVLDRDGVIVDVNGAWKDFEAVRAQTGIESALTGDNYLELLDNLAARGHSDAARGREAIRAVLRGEQPFTSIDYQFAVGASTRWFLARVVAMEGSEHAVISHQDITDQMMAHMALEDAHRRLQVLSQRVLSIQEEERRTISRELHDDIGQTLAALKIGLHRMSAVPPEEGRRLLADCLAAADEALERLRRLAQQLRPPQLDQLGLPEALAWLGENMERASGVRVAVDSRGLSGGRPPATLEIACYRIAQEAMNNAIRHARATRIQVSIECDGKLLKVGVMDDGAGFDANAARERAVLAGSLGIIGMEERAQLAGGRTRIRSVPGGGTTVAAIFPLQSEAVLPTGERCIPEST